MFIIYLMNYIYKNVNYIGRWGVRNWEGGYLLIVDNFFIWYIWLKDLGWCKMFRIGYYCLNRMLLEWNFFKMYYVFVF